MASSRAPAPTRDRILASAERLFAERGYEGVSMPAIAAAARITAGAIYKHFTSKADLFFVVVRQAVLATASATAGGPAGTLRGGVARFTTRPLKRLRQLSIETHAAAGRNPQVRALLRKALEAQVADIAADIAARQQTGELAALDATLAAQAVMVFIMGLTHLDTLAPSLVGDAAFHAFVEDRLEALIGRK